MKREELIEEAAKAILDEAGVLPSERYDEMWELARRDAEAALGVFEQAHTPTDDESHLIEELRRCAQESAYGSHASNSPLLQGAALVARAADALERRTVQGEPTEHFHIWSDLPCKAGECRMEPQPEPTDAQVRAAWDSFGPAKTLRFTYEDMRAALRAAFAVTEQEGEGR